MKSMVNLLPCSKFGHFGVGLQENSHTDHLLSFAMSNPVLFGKFTGSDKRGNGIFMNLLQVQKISQSPWRSLKQTTMGAFLVKNQYSLGSRALKTNAAYPIELPEKAAFTTENAQVGYVLFDGTLGLPIAVLRVDKHGAVIGKLIGRYTSESVYETLQIGLRSLANEANKSRWLFT